MFVFGVHPLELVARTAIVYVVFVAVLRVFGKRELGQFTIFDLALLLLAANALQPAMTGPDNSVLGGLVILATVFALNWLTARVREHVPWRGVCWSPNRRSSPATVSGWTRPWRPRTWTRTTSRRRCGSMAWSGSRTLGWSFSNRTGRSAWCPARATARRSAADGFARGVSDGRDTDRCARRHHASCRPARRSRRLRQPDRP